MQTVNNLGGIYHWLMAVMAPVTEEVIFRGLLFGSIIVILNYRYSINDKFNPFKCLEKKQKYEYLILFVFFSCLISYFFGLLHTYQHHVVPYAIPVGSIRTFIDSMLFFGLRFLSGSLFLPLFFHLFIDTGFATKKWMIF